MFDPKSRYFRLEDRSYTDPYGRTFVYKSRRFLPRKATGPVLAETEVEQSDRPDLMAFRTLGDPLLFWRVCDDNGVMNPFDLNSSPGRRLRVLLPQP